MPAVTKAEKQDETPAKANGVPNDHQATTATTASNNQEETTHDTEQSDNTSNNNHYHDIAEELATNITNDLISNLWSINFETDENKPNLPKTTTEDNSSQNDNAQEQTEEDSENHEEDKENDEDGEDKAKDNKKHDETEEDNLDADWAIEGTDWVWIS
jgi:hypothetical protein